MNLLPIKPSLGENPRFRDHPDCQETLGMTLGYYQQVGFKPPWISYYLEKDDVLVGLGAFKGPPQKGIVEIAYATFASFRNQGIGNQICQELLKLAQATDPAIRITARTLTEPGYSTRILKKNGFIYQGIVQDPDDGEVWEWEYNP